VEKRRRGRGGGSAAPAYLPFLRCSARVGGGGARSGLGEWRRGKGRGGEERPINPSTL
jgi:hypothetical protein